MVWNRIDLKNFAKDSMRKNYGACVLAAFLISLVLGLDAGTLSQLEDFEMYIPEGITVTVSWMTLLIAIFAGKRVHCWLLSVFCGKQRISGASIQSVPWISKWALHQCGVDYVS